MSKKLSQENSVEDQLDQTIKDCFIITPIGDIQSETFKKTTGLLEAVIEPVLLSLGFQAVPAHYIASPGSIPKQILKHIVEDELVIVNLTGLNPNVMYELAVRHAVRLPVVIMAEDGTKLPFDVLDQRTIFYSDSFQGLSECRSKLDIALKHILQEGYIPDNPIYDAIESNNILKNTKPESKEEYLVNRLDKIESVLSTLSRSQNLSKDPVFYGNTTFHNNHTIKVILNPGALVEEGRKEILNVFAKYAYNLFANLNISEKSVFFEIKTNNLDIKSIPILVNEISKCPSVSNVYLV